MSDSTWEHKDEWRRYGRTMNFLVTVTRHEVKPLTGFDYGRGPHRWAVYVYFYPRHPHFARFAVAGGMGQDAADALPLHCGPTLFRTHPAPPEAVKPAGFVGLGPIGSFQVGADYDHLHDQHYTHMATKGEAASVFADAEELFAWAEAHDAQQEKTEATHA